MLRFFYLNKRRDAVDANCHSVSFRCWDNLQCSIDEIGIIAPLLVRYRSEKWEIICGKGRWNCARKDTQIPALEIECNDIQALNYHIHDNRDRGFNSIEIARVIHRLQLDMAMTMTEISSGYAHLLKLPSGTRVMADYLKILRLPSSVQQQVRDGMLAWRSAVILTDFDGEEAKILADLAVAMHYNTNKQREVFTLLWELSRGNNTNIQGILAHDELKKLWQCANPAANANEFRQRLQQIKSPAFSSTTARFCRILEEIPPAITIHPTPAFEKPDIRIEFSCQNVESFRSALTSLHQLEKNGIVAQLFNITDME